MIPTSISVSTDLSEYCRFEEAKKIITYSVTVGGSNLMGEEITVQLVKARRNRDVVAAFVTLTLTSPDPATYTGTFDLSKIVDTDEVPKIRRGKYLVRALSVSDNSVFGDSPDFRVSLVSAARLKSEYLFGVDFKATEQLQSLEQPFIVTGVTVTDISKNHSQGWIPLSYNYTDDGMGGIVRTLSWCGGPQITIIPGKNTYNLRRGSSIDYITLNVNQAALPTASVSEELFITLKTFDDSFIQVAVDEAISWLEDVALFINLEPTLITTTETSTVAVTPDGTDIPQFIQVDWDKVVDAVSYSYPTAKHWINFKFPYRPLIKFNELHGEIATVHVLTVALEWVQRHERGGFVEFVPLNRDLAFNFLGYAWIQQLRGVVDFPNFWHFEALVGFRDLPRVLIEMVAKKATIDLLMFAQQARRPGIGSQGISRDGVSENLSYIHNAQYGIYNPTIKLLQDWLDAELKKFKGAFNGARVLVV